MVWEALSHGKILHIALLVITLSLLCSYANADKSNTVSISHLHLSIIQPSNNTSIKTDTFQIRGNSSGDFMIPSVSWSIDNSPTWMAGGTTNWSFMVSSLSEGMHTIHVNVIDKKGNEQNKFIKVMIDMKPPMLSISSPTTDDSLDHITSINGTAYDDNAISQVTIIVDNQYVYNATYSKGFWSAPVKLYAGTHMVESVAQDKAGNSAVSRNVYFSLNNPKPPVISEKIPYAQTSPFSTSGTSNLGKDTQNTQNITIISNSNHNSHSSSSNSNSHSGASHGNSHSNNSSHK